jgi:hypothetical protein
VHTETILWHVWAYSSSFQAETLLDLSGAGSKPSTLIGLAK